MKTFFSIHLQDHHNDRKVEIIGQVTNHADHLHGEWNPDTSFCSSFWKVLHHCSSMQYAHDLEDKCKIQLSAQIEVHLMMLNNPFLIFESVTNYCSFLDDSK